jgi:hypothetical protein
VPQPLSRRAVLAAAAAAGLATATSSCSPLTGSGPAVPPARPDPLEPLLTAELALVSGYDAVLAKFPAAAGQLKAIRAEHHQHAQALRARLDPRRQIAVPDAAPPAVDATSQAAAAAKLARAERDAADRMAKACLAATGDLCALLASISASEASHAAVLS